MHSNISRTTSETLSLFSAPLFSAPACAGDTTFDWTPTPEPPLLPAPQLALCMGCPDRQRCLDWAIDNDAHGIWGGTTRHQRHQLNDPDPEPEPPIHDGPGSTSLYRRGCRCTQCRAAQAERIRQQRARRRAREEKK